MDAVSAGPRLPAQRMPADQVHGRVGGTDGSSAFISLGRDFYEILIIHGLVFFPFHLPRLACCERWAADGVSDLQRDAM